MDDFLTKPVDVEQLSSTLERWLVRAAIDATPSLGRLDLARLDELRALDGGVGETSYVARAIGNLLGSAPLDLGRHGPGGRGRATPNGSARVSHRLAGAALNLGATLGGEAARELEDAVRSGGPVPDLPDRLASPRGARRGPRARWRTSATGWSSRLLTPTPRPRRSSSSRPSRRAEATISRTWVRVPQPSSISRLRSVANASPSSARTRRRPPRGPG